MYRIFNDWFNELYTTFINSNSCDNYCIWYIYPVFNQNNFKKSITLKSTFIEWRPLKVRVFIMQLIGWIEFGIRPDSVQSILLLIVRGYTSRCNLQFVVLILHSLLISLHNTFLALKCQKNSPLKHCL